MPTRYNAKQIHFTSTTGDPQMRGFLLLLAIACMAIIAIAAAPTKSEKQIRENDQAINHQEVTACPDAAVAGIFHHGKKCHRRPLRGLLRKLAGHC